MLRVGLTGGIGAGKSTVARRLRELGAVVIDADRLAREVVAPGSSGLAEIVAAFGPGVLAASGALDRAALGRIVFSDTVALARLNAITHPRIAESTAQIMTAAAPDAVVVHDVPLLVENGLQSLYHLVLVVHAPQDVRVARLVRDRGMGEADAWARVRVQADDDARRAAADVWLDNAGDPSAVLDAVDRLWEERLREFERNLRTQRVAVRPALVPRQTDGVRVLARVRHAVGDRAVRIDLLHPCAGLGGVHDAVEVQIVTADLQVAESVAPDLTAAGLVRLPGRRGDVTADGQRWEWICLASADPGLPVGCRLHPLESPAWRQALAPDDGPRG